AAAGGPPAGGPGGGGPGGKGEPSFEDAVKDYRRIEGLIDAYEKDGRYLLALDPGDFDKDFMVSMTRETGVGQFGLLAAQVVGEVPVRFQKVGKRVQMLLRNTRFTAQQDPDIRRAVDKSFSDSLAGSAKLESQPHPDSKAILVELAPFLISDLEGIGQFFAQVFQTPYNLDRENSYLDAVKGFPHNVEVSARLHFGAGRPANFVNLPDARSLFLTYRFSFSDVPDAAGFMPRLADDRVGHFIALFQDFSDDNRETPYVRYVTRWNLQKEEPYAALSKPTEPITYWIENSVPKKYRKALADGTLMWNKAFEKAGFKDAVVVKQQPDDADWDPADVRYSTIRWFLATDAAFAIGPSRINPLTGQIYDADIGWSDGLIAGRLREFEELTDPVTSLKNIFRSVTEPRAAGTEPRFACDFATGAMEQVNFGLDLLAARGVEPGSPQYQEYIEGFITYVQAHEVGHTLGLRHNFRSSSSVGNEQLQDASITSRSGMVGSVMDYVPVNIAASGKRQGQYWPTTLGPYDYWAIEYAYKPIPGAKKPEDELPELKAIATRVAEQGLAYGTDEDTSDPRTNTWDLGADPMAFYADRTSIVRELWKDIPQRLAREGDGYQVMRRAFHRGFGQFALSVANVTKSIGGLNTHRDHVADPSGRLPMVPLPPQTQRAALAFLKANVFSTDAFQAPPDLLNKLAMTRWWDFSGSIFGVPRMEYPLHDVVLALQQQTMQSLYNPVKLDRLVDLEMQVPAAQKPFTLAEMFTGVHDAVWSEVYGSAVPQVNSFRRALQREHMRRMSDLMLKASPDTPEDAVSLARASLNNLKARLDVVLKGGQSPDPATRAHLDETRARIEAALAAFMTRSVG
ncbi:MAG: zinc-dependent metalloprotease, partial [Candidatus Polarisedimenticolia bacterium]